MDNPKYAGVVATCKRYDKAIEKVAKNGGEIHCTATTTEKVVCTYPKCGKAVHTQAPCWMKKKDQKVAELKHVGKSKANQDSNQSNGSQQITMEASMASRRSCMVVAFAVVLRITKLRSVQIELLVVTVEEPPKNSKVTRTSDRSRTGTRMCGLMSRIQMMRSARLRRTTLLRRF